MKARAVQWLAQRDHSELELRRKLVAAERRSERRSVADASRASEDASARQSGAVAAAAAAFGSGTHTRANSNSESDSAARACMGAPTHTCTGIDPADQDVEGQRQLRIDDAIVWLRQHDFLNDARFVESRVNARARQFGVMRIRQELGMHGVDLPDDMASDLRASEFERADAMRRRRWGDDRVELAEQARCARWLAQRGFSGDTVARVVRAMRSGVGADGSSSDIANDA